jgi:aquaporin Z
MDKAFRAYIAEFIGTFTLVFIGTAVAVLSGVEGLKPHQAKWLEIAFAFGGTLAVLVWVIGPVSGCHVNPAVSLPMALAGRLPWSRLPGYMIAQFIGAIAASAVLLSLCKGIPAEIGAGQSKAPGYHEAINGLGQNTNATGMPLTHLAGWEALMTALFIMTIFAVTRKDATPGFAGLAIGGFLFVAHLVGAQLGDSSLNPARSLGPAVWVGGDAFSVLWAFVAGPFAGGVAGWLLYKVVYED